jgi:hypothetical protein
MPQVTAPLDLDLVVDPAATPLDLDRLFEALDRVVSQRLKLRKPATPVRSPAVRLSIFTPEE